MIFFSEGSIKSSLLGQRALVCKTLLIPATGSLELALLEGSSIKYEWRAGAEI
jgi:hypothetical protein